MKRIYFYSPVILLLIIIWGCEKSNNTETTDYKPALQYSLDTTWQGFTSHLPNWQGGLGVYISCPKGNYFVSTSLEPGASANSRFRVASITKSFTATAIMLLDQQGKLNIDDKVTNMIPGTNIPYLPNDTSYQIPYKDHITIRQLIEHRANIFDQVNSPVPDTVNAWYAGQIYYLAILTQKDRYHQFTLDELHRLISRHQLSYGEPGLEHHYSNNGYTLLAKIIERVSGKAYHDFVREELFIKNHLQQTTLPYLGTDTALTAPFLHGNLYMNNSSIDITNFNMSFGIAEGNMISSFRDLSLFYRNLFTGNAGVNPTQVSRMMECRPSNESYGLGIEFYEGLGYGHSGSQLGYLTFVGYDPTNDFMVISESTLFPKDYSLKQAQGRIIVNLLKQMKQTLGYSLEMSD